MNDPKQLVTGHAAMHAAPMLPTPPDCGAPCAMCESYAHLLAKAREESAQLANHLSGAELARDELGARAERAEAENSALRKRILDDNKAYGCELRDPAGTIWDHAAQLQREVARLAAKLNTEETLYDGACDVAGGDPVQVIYALRAEVARLRDSHAAIYLALGTNEADHTKWPQQIIALREKYQQLSEQHQEAVFTRDRLDTENATLLAALEKCFAYVGRQIKCKTLNVSAADGTQALSSELAKLLDSRAAIASAKGGAK